MANAVNAVLVEKGVHTPKTFSDRTCSQGMIMSNIVGIILCIVWFFINPGASQAQGWRGIVPLHSTRAEVEASIGPPMQPNGWTYDLKNERVNIVYATANCDNNRVEWNVPRDTVISITIYPQTALVLADLQIDLTKFEKFVNVNNRDYVSYTNKEAGVAVGTRSNGEVVVIEYFPSEQDKHLRCPKFSPNELTLDELKYFRFDEYSDLSFTDEKARLHNFAARLAREPGTKGYIIIHASQSISATEIQGRLKRAKDYLVRDRRINPSRLVVVRGGSAEKLETTLYVVPNVFSLSPDR
jgi:hypothetical protein